MNVLTSPNFKLLDKKSQELVLTLQTKYDKMRPLEKLAFLELCGLRSIADDSAAAEKENRGKLKHYMNERLADTRSREPGYVVLQQDVVVPSNKTEPNAGSYANASSDASLRKLIQPSLFGEAKAEVRKQRKSIYEKIGMEGEDEEEEVEEDIVQRAEPAGLPGQYTYSSNAYQALRLAHSFPQHINVRPGTKDDMQTPNLMNVTSIPVGEYELRGWFDSLDSSQTGYLELKDFMSFMRSLERDLGVEDEYERLEKEGQRLASDGKLGFEAFAYLVLRFVRA